MTPKTRTIAGTELHPVGLGCMNLSWAYGTPPSREEGARLLARTLDLGCNHFDTARIYGAGQNEALIGETLQGRRNEFFLASKCGIVVDGPRRGVDCSPEAIDSAIEESLKLLRTDHIDLYYMHRFDPKVPVAESVGALAGLLRDPSTLEEQDLRTKMPRFNAENWPHNRALIDRFVALAQDAGVTAAQLALAWVLSRGDHVHVIPGTTKEQHLADNLRAAGLAVPQDVLDAADALINEQTVAGHRYHDAIRPTIDTEEFEPA